MSKKRKSSDSHHKVGPKVKRTKTGSAADIKKEQHPVLRLHYENVTTLREYLLTRFPSSSLSRKQRIKAVPPWLGGSRQLEHEREATLPSLATVSIDQQPVTSEAHVDLSNLLDTTIIGFQTVKSRHSGGPSMTNLYQPQNVQQLSQKLQSTLKSTSTQGSNCQYQACMNIYASYKTLTRSPDC